jgi:hypothetical protein
LSARPRTPLSGSAPGPSRPRGRRAGASASARCHPRSSPTF